MIGNTEILFMVYIHLKNRRFSKVHYDDISIPELYQKYKLVFVSRYNQAGPETEYSGNYYKPRSGSIVIVAKIPLDLYYRSGNLAGITHLVAKGNSNL